jgi:hypothetical protein
VYRRLYTTFLQVSFIFSPEQKFNQFPRPPVVHSSLNCFLRLTGNHNFCNSPFPRHYYEPVYYCLFDIYRDSYNTLSLFESCPFGDIVLFFSKLPPFRVPDYFTERNLRCLIFCKHQIKLSQVKFRIVRPSIPSFICFRMD